jgi:hypothetical protein
VTGVRIAKALRDQITAEAGQRCGYCLTPQEHTAMPMEIEHIIPRAIGGPTTQDNLWLACPLCNGHKATQTHGTDPMSGDRTPIFNPRKQIWGEHFAWSQDGTRIVGLRWKQHDVYQKAFDRLLRDLKAEGQQAADVSDVQG